MENQQAAFSQSVRQQQYFGLVDQQVLDQLGQKLKLQNGSIARAKVPAINMAALRKNKLTLPSIILKKRQINFDGGDNQSKKLPDIIPTIQVQNQNSAHSRHSSQSSSRNIMSDDLLRKSSLFRRDMRKLNIMKEVKVLLENKQRMDILSPARHKLNSPIKPEGFQGIGGQYRFPFHRRASLGEEIMKPTIPQLVNSQPSSPSRQQQIQTSHSSFKSPRISMSRLGSHHIIDGDRWSVKNNMPVKANNHKIFQDQFMKIIENSYMLNDSNSVSMMQKDTAVATTSEDNSQNLQESKYYSQILNEDIFQQTFEQLVDDNEQILEVCEEGEQSPNEVDGWFLNTIAEVAKQKNLKEELKEPDLGYFLDECKRTQEYEMQQTLSDIITLIKSKNIINFVDNIEKNPSNSTRTGGILQQRSQNSSNNLNYNLNSQDVIISEMENFFIEMEDRSSSFQKPSGTDKKVVSKNKVFQ